MALNSDLPRPISDAEIEAFERDGVVCLRGMFDREWVARMRDACLNHAADPSPHLIERWGTPQAAPPGAAFSFMAHTTDDFADFMRHSPMGQIAAALMKADEVRYWYDQLFVKEPVGGDGADPQNLRQSRTFWHNDLPFWPLRGNDIVSIWVPFVPVTRSESGLEYIASSPRTGQMYRPYLSAASDLGEELPPCPDFDTLRDDLSLRFLGWDLNAGDCLVHHPLTVHASSENRGRNPRIALSTRFLGADVRYHPIGIRWFPQEPDVAPGARPDDSEHFPVIWPRAA